jgi:hypothetical protein
LFEAVTWIFHPTKDAYVNLFDGVMADLGTMISYTVGDGVYEAYSLGNGYHITEMSIVLMVCIFFFTIAESIGFDRMPHCLNRPVFTRPLRITWKHLLSYVAHLLLTYFALGSTEFYYNLALILVVRLVPAWVAVSSNVWFHLLWNMCVCTMSIYVGCPSLFYENLFLAFSPASFLGLLQRPNPNDFWTCSHCGAEHWYRAVSCSKCGTRRGASADVNAWSDFKALYSKADFKGAFGIRGQCSMLLGDRLPATHPNPFTHLALPKESRHKLVGRFRGFEQNLDFWPLDPIKDVLQPLLATNVPLVVPNNGLFTLLHALQNRNCKLVPEPTSPKLWHSTAGQFCSFLRFRLKHIPFIPRDLYEWVNSSYDGANRREKLEYLDAVTSLPPTVHQYIPVNDDPVPRWFAKVIKKKGNNMFAKTDEKLFPKFTEFYAGVKPRTIQSVPFPVQVATQPDIHAATSRLKTALQEPFSITLNGETKRYWVSYAGGMTGTDLTDWLVRAEQFALLGCISAIVMGDDALIIQLERDEEGVSLNRLEYLENDYSSFDQSQGNIPNLYENKVLGALGVRRSVVDILKLTGRAKASGKRRNGKCTASLKFTPGTQNRVTGAPNTSLSNTTNNIIGIIIASFFGYSEEGWAKVGFIAKMRKSSVITEVTFLRGTWFYHGDDTYRWGILPSAILKLGTVMCKVKTTVELRTLAYGTALGMVGIPFHFPILGVFKRRLLEIGMEGPERKNKRRPDSNLDDSLDRSLLLDWMCARYHVTRGDIISLEAKLAIITLPSFIGDSVFSAMAIDYS